MINSAYSGLLVYVYMEDQINFPFCRDCIVPSHLAGFDRHLLWGRDGIMFKMFPFSYDLIQGVT